MSKALTVGRRRKWHRRAAFAALLAPALVGAFYGLRWVADNAYVIEFRPACNDYDRHEFDLDRLHLVFGEPTDEFWRELKRYYSEPTPATFVRFEDGKAYVRWRFYLPESQFPKFEHEFEENAHHATREVAYRIFRRRLEEGRFDGVDMSPYMATRGPNMKRIDEPVLMKYDECGFLEELILEGGRFAGLDPADDPTPTR